MHEQWAWQAVTHVAPEASQSTAACWVQSGSAGLLPAPPFSSGAQVSHLQGLWEAMAVPRKGLQGSVLGWFCGRSSSPRSAGGGMHSC